MSITRKSIATAIIAAALGAPALTAFAVDQANGANGYGRAGGTSNWTQSDRLSSTDGERVYGSTTISGNWYGRAGGVTGSDDVALSATWDSDNVEPTSMPSFPGRQGAPMTIDQFRG